MKNYVSCAFTLTRPKGEIDVRFLVDGNPIRRKYKARMSREVAPHQRLLRTKETAQYLGISQRTLRKLVWEKQIKVFQQDDCQPWMFDRQELRMNRDKAELLNAQLKPALGGCACIKNSHQFQTTTIPTIAITNRKQSAMMS